MFGELIIKPHHMFQSLILFHLSLYHFSDNHLRNASFAERLPTQIVDLHVVVFYMFNSSKSNTCLTYFKHHCDCF